MEHLLNSILPQINAAKEQILRGIVEKIEGRPAEIEDGARFILKKASSWPDLSLVYYKGVYMGEMAIGHSYDPNGEAAPKISVVFTPQILELKN